MNFDNPAWKRAPVRTGVRVFASLARRMVPQLSRVAVSYDGGRSRVYADLGTPMGLHLYRYGHRDPDVELVGRLLGPGDLFVDGGANVGLFTLVAAERVGETGKVVAFEPGRLVRLRLLENVVLNRFEQVVVMPFALASESGEASFREFDVAGAGLNHLAPAADEEGHIDTVSLTTLDATLTPRDLARLRLVKLDLEGAEYAALLGASRVLRDARPDILIEIEPAHLQRMGSTADAVVALLRERDYRLYKPGSDDAGQVMLRPVADVTALGAGGPNVFATVDVGRARRRGVRITDS